MFLSFGDVLVSTNSSDGAAMFVLYYIKPHGEIAGFPICIDHPVFQIAGVERIGTFNGLFYFFAYQSDILGMQKLFAVSLCRYSVTAHFFNACLQNAIEMIIEGEHSFFYVELPVTKLCKLGGYRKLCSTF